METDMNALLQRYTQPVFLVRNGTVAFTNPAAAARQVQVGMNINDLVCVGKEEYSQFTEGRLYLAVCAGDEAYNACAEKLDEYHIFFLEGEYEDPTLRGFALAAKHLRQPLANALMCADGLSGPQEDLGFLKQSLYQLHRNLCNMSDVAIYGGARSARSENTDICAFVEEILEKAAALLERTGISICYAGPKSAVICSVDSEKLERAILNLLSNAAKFASANKPISVTLCKKGSRVFLSVENEGPQIPTQVQEDLFCRYLREPLLEDSRFGIGLGLSIVRSTAIAHNGTLLLENTPTGHKFTMTLAVEHPRDHIVRSPVLLPVDYTGGYDKTLVELSDVLPADLYE